jgi:enoyl-CoA hydratase/carnithine racemase
VVLAAACDVRIGSTDARFWIPELEAGIPLAWGGMAYLVRLVGETVAADVVLTARPFDAEEALRAGFVSRVVSSMDFDDEVGAVVDAVAAKSWLPLRLTKIQLQAIRSGTFDAKGDAAALLAAIDDSEAGELFRAYAARLS